MCECRMAKVKIKTWAEMEKEYGLTVCGEIDCDAVFTDEMEEQMPANRIVEIDCRYGDIGSWCDWNGWDISEDMVAEVLHCEF